MAIMMAAKMGRATELVDELVDYRKRSRPLGPALSTTPITLVGDDALGIVIHLVLAVGDMLADAIQQVLAKLHLVVALQQLNGVPTQEAVIDLALDGSRYGTSAAGKYMGQLSTSASLAAAMAASAACWEPLPFRAENRSLTAPWRACSG